jgi:hypothetical protein
MNSKTNNMKGPSASQNRITTQQRADIYSEGFMTAEREGDEVINHLSKKLTKMKAEREELKTLLGKAWEVLQ